MPANNVVLTGSWMQTPYTVTYKYKGEAPEGATVLPEPIKHYKADAVTLLPVNVPEGWTFSGWSTSDATIENGGFTMPAKDVLLTGSWMKIPEYSVTISGDEGIAQVTNTDTVTPDIGENWVSVAKTYREGSHVTVAYQMKPNYQLVSVKVNGEPLQNLPADNSLSFENLKADQSVEVITGLKPSYRVVFEYYTIEDGVEHSTPDGMDDTDVIYCSSTTPISIPLKPAYGGNTYENPTITENTAGASLDASAGMVDNIIPDTATAKVVVKLTRTVTNSAVYHVMHEYYTFDPDGNKSKTETDQLDSDLTGIHGQQITAAKVSKPITGYSKAADSGDITLDKAEEKTITIEYWRFQHRVAIDGDEGVEILSGTPSAQKGMVYDKGASGSVAFAVKDGYELVAVLVDGNPVENPDTSITFEDLSANHLVQVTTKKRESAKAIVHFVDEQNQLLREDWETDFIYVGSVYDLSGALSLDELTKDGNLFVFSHHYRKAGETRISQGQLPAQAADYSGDMPAEGVEITRVYQQKKVLYYYQEKYVYTGYDADGVLFYQDEALNPVQITEATQHEVTPPEQFSRDGYTFSLTVPAEAKTLTSIDPNAPDVFVSYYEYHMEASSDNPPPPTDDPQNPGNTTPPPTDDPQNPGNTTPPPGDDPQNPGNTTPPPGDDPQDPDNTPLPSEDAPQNPGDNDQSSIPGTDNSDGSLQPVRPEPSVTPAPLPPKTGDEGPALWLVLMLAAVAGLLLLARKQYG